MKKILSTIITSPLKGRLGGVLFALLATTALWAEQFEANGLRYTITSESTVEVAGYDWYDQVLTIPSEVTGPIVKNEVHPELPNPGAGKITICVQVAQPFCEGVSIVIPGTITSWEEGDATANGQVIEKVDNTESWYAGTFDWNTDEQSELPRFKIAHTLTDGTWYWDYQAYNLEFVQGNAWRDYEGGDIYIGADDQIIYIRVLDWNTTSCLDDSKVETTTYQVTGVAPWAFSGIPNSSSAVMIPNSISYIGEGAFSGFNGNVVLEATTPPNNIAAFNTEASICVPCAALEAYQQHDEWSYLNLKGLNYNLNVAADHGGGYVRVTSSDCETGNATIETFASYDYISFSQWSDGSTENPRTLSLTQDTTIIAQYIEKPSYNVTLQGFNLQASYCEGYTDCQDYSGEYVQFNVHEGTVITLQDNTSDYASFSEWSDGVTEHPRTITITQDTIIESKYVEKPSYNVTLKGFSLYASWNDRWGYQESWNNHIQFSVYEGSQVNFSEQSGCGEWLGWSDGVLDNERTITITSDTTITSRLNVETYSVKVTAESGGYIEGGDIETERNECDSWLWICAQPWDGYYFKGWSNGNQNSCTDIYINQDTTLVAYFAEMKAVNLNVSVIDSCADMGRVEGGGQYFTGDRVMISAIPNEGYHFMEWSDGGLSPEREIYLTSDTTLTASFAPGEIGGKCGKNLTWTYDPLTTTLTITGSGDMYNGMQQWHDQYSSEITTINLPNTMTSIGEYAFGDCTSLTSIIIPNGVTSIGESAFSLCSSLTSVVIPNSVTSIGNEAFTHCYSLTSINIPNSVTSIGEAAFGQCVALSAINIPNSVNSIAPGAFCECFALASVTLPENLTSIEYYLFYECYALNHITIPSSVTTIEDGAFGWCQSLTSITIPSSVTSIKGEFVFENCIFVKENFINNSSLDAQANNYWGAMIVNSETDGLIIRNDTVIDCRPNVISANIPTNVTAIGDHAFENCQSLTSVTIPNSVTSIGESAFQATSLTSIVVPENVTHIGRYAFADVEALKTVEIGSGVKELNATFVECLSLESIILSEGLETIGENTFCACPSLATINIPNSVTSIGEYAFADCYALTSITIPSSVTSIEGESVFAGCIFVKENFINNSSLDAQANNYWGATIVDSDTDGLLIRNDTVIGCKPHITSANIPANVTAIGESAFYYCTSLTSVTIPNSVTTIGNYAFEGCSSLTSVTIPNSVTSIGDYAFSSAALKSIVVPDNVTYIGRAAFADMEETLKSAVIGSGVKELNATFVECMSLESVILSEGLETIGDEVFNGCNSLNSVNIPHSVTSIGYAAFAGCLPLESIVIPSGVTNIGDWAFNYCTSLSSVTCLAMTPSAMGEWVFDGCDNPTLFVLCNALSNYQAHEQWGQFANIECIGSEEVETEEVVIESGTTTISITWPTEESANTYTIVVKKADEVVCTLIFNAEGQLINAAFAPGRNGNRPAQYAEQVADGSGFRFTVTGLEDGTDYTYEVVTKDEEDNTLSTYSGEFTTQRNIATDVENTDAQYPTSDIQKIMHNGQLLILRDGKTYNVMGAEIQ